VVGVGSRILVRQNRTWTAEFTILMVGAMPRGQLGRRRWPKPPAPLPRAAAPALRAGAGQLSDRWEDLSVGVPGRCLELGYSFETDSPTICLTSA